MKKNLIITIGRENGSGGKYIGEKLAKSLGIKCYDSSLIKETAKNFNLDTKYIEQFDEMPPRGLLYFGGQPIPMDLFLEESETIKEIASKESCVIIGRASNYVLRDYDNVINVFIHAPMGARIERYCRRNNTSIINAEKEIKKKDKLRATYYQYYTNQKWGDSKNYDLSIDSSKVGIDGAIEIIKKYIEINGSKDEQSI